jgi:hypothetical protein
MFDSLVAATDGQVNARRNLYLGIWAGTRLGFRDETLLSYARAMVTQPPDALVVNVCRDFATRGLESCPHFVSSQLQRMERDARQEMLATD